MVIWFFTLFTPFTNAQKYAIPAIPKAFGSRESFLKKDSGQAEMTGKR
jgi:hypothetical protein